MFKKIFCFALCAIMLCGCFLIGASADSPVHRRIYTVTFPEFGNLNIADTDGHFFSIPADNVSFSYSYFDISESDVRNESYSPSVMSDTIVYFDWYVDPGMDDAFTISVGDSTFFSMYTTYDFYDPETGSASYQMTTVDDIEASNINLTLMFVELDSEVLRLIDDLSRFIGTPTITEAPYEEQGTLGAIKLMFTNFGIAIGGLAEGIKESTTNLLWKDPSATNRQLSDVAIFIFTIAGLAIGMTVFFLVFRLIRFGRQR